MLGLGSVEMAVAYILCLLAALLCVVYGVVKWNDMGRYSMEADEKLDWERKEKALKEQLP
jgi:hypothetical protein